MKDEVIIDVRVAYLRPDEIGYRYAIPRSIMEKIGPIPYEAYLDPFEAIKIQKLLKDRSDIADNIGRQIAMSIIDFISKKDE